MQTTGIDRIPHNQNITINKSLQNFKQKLEQLFISWWKNEKTSKNTKLTPFYYKHKNTFNFETYLDNVPRHIRPFLTKLRISGHCLPVEVLRYAKTEIHRSERLCPICNLGEVGNEEHYLLKCNNAELSFIRQNFFKNIKEEVTQLKQFANQNIIDYCFNLND